MSVIITGRNHFPTFVWLILCALPLVNGCVNSRVTASKLIRCEFEQPHMGTLFKITLYATNETSARLASDAAFAKVAALDRMMTDYDPESELMQLCRQPANMPVRVSEDLFAVLEESLRIARDSDGAFDPTIGPVIRQWRRARRQGILPTRDQTELAQQSVGWRNLILDSKNRTATLLASNMQLDLGGIAKGYAADAALAELKAHGITRALVAASGDIAAGDAPPGEEGWRISIGTPHSNSNLSKTFLLSHAAVSTSGDSEQFVVIDGHRYSHIVDPRTGVGLTNQLQVSVFAGSATLTDAYATAVSVLGEEPGLALIQSQPQMATILFHNKNGNLAIKMSHPKVSLPGVIEK